VVEIDCQTTANHDRTGPITTDLESNVKAGLKLHQ
jgi:hypothetical protein